MLVFQWRDERDIHTYSIQLYFVYFFLLAQRMKNCKKCDEVKIYILQSAFGFCIVRFQILFVYVNNL